MKYDFKCIECGSVRTVECSYADKPEENEIVCMYCNSPVKRWYGDTHITITGLNASFHDGILDLDSGRYISQAESREHEKRTNTVLIGREEQKQQAAMNKKRNAEKKEQESIKKLKKNMYSAMSQK